MFIASIFIEQNFSRSTRSFIKNADVNRRTNFNELKTKLINEAPLSCSFYALRLLLSRTMLFVINEVLCNYSNVVTDGLQTSDVAIFDDEYS